MVCDVLCVYGLEMQQMSISLIPSCCLLSQTQSRNCTVSCIVGKPQISENSPYEDQNTSSRNTNLMERMPQIMTSMGDALTAQ